MGMCRFFYSSAIYQNINSSALSTLRKKTGFTFANCRKALELHNNDMKKAEEWLKEQAKALGWATALKVQSRKACYGLIGISKSKKKLAMVEVNCETDFVSKNDTFKSLVGLVSKACLQYPVLQAGKDTNQVVLSSEELGKLKISNGTLADEVALAIGSIGENMILRRAYCYETVRNDINVAVSVHPSCTNSANLFGKYGSFVSFIKNPKVSCEDSVEIIGSELCKHIIGMNPTKIGDVEVDVPKKDKDSESILIYQDFLIDDSKTVGEFLTDSGVTVLDFKRFECGEPDVEDEGADDEKVKEAKSI